MRGFDTWNHGLGVILPLLIVAGMILIVLAAWRTITNATDPLEQAIMDELDIHYFDGKITEDEYIQRKMILEDTEASRPELIHLKKQYASGGIDTEEFLSLRRNFKQES